MLRIIPALITALLLLSPVVANGQTLGLHGSGGPTMIDAGHSLAAGVGLSPTSRVTFVVDFERTHVSSRVHTDSRGNVAAFRGGTTTLAAASVSVALFGRDRVGPYALAGMAAGVSRPNVTAIFPHAVTNEVRAPFIGGGIQVPLGDRISIFADARMMLVIGKDADELFAIAPFRAGIAWHF